MYRLINLFFTLSFCLLFFSIGNAQPGNNQIGQLKVFNINSEILNEERVISVFLPRSYESSESYYPLLVVLDGEDFLQPITGMVSYYSKIGRCPELIVVGIESRDRWRDYTPTNAPIPDGTPLPTSGGADSYYRFITNELLLMLNEEYRISPFNVLFGHSVAGLFVIDNVFEEQTNFSGFIATSPSLWWDGEFISNLSKAYYGYQFSHPRYLYFTMGNEGPTMLNPALRFKETLSGIDKNQILWKFEQFILADHQTMPIKAFIYGLEFIFSDWRMPQNLYDEGLSSIINYYNALSEKYMQKIIPPESTINRLGYLAVNKGMMDEALEIFRYNVTLYPNSGNVYDSLGEAYLKDGDSLRAIENYKKSLELNPDNEHAMEIIRKLESNTK